MVTKYDPLRKWLTQADGHRIRLSFREIESVLGFRLPNSARTLPPWWANTRGSHVQAAAWMEAGWRTRDVDIAGGKVSFERAIPAPPAAVPQPADVPGVADAGVPYRTEEPIVVERSALRGGAIRMLEDYREARGGDLADAIIGLLNGMAIERRRQLLDRFPLSGAPASIDSVDLIREDRDAR